MTKRVLGAEEALRVEPKVWAAVKVGVEDIETPADQILKPSFDLLWIACGFESSQNFDANGNWAPRRRM